MGRRVIKLVLGGLPTRSRTRRPQVGDQIHDEVGPAPGGVGDRGVLLIHRGDPAVGLCHRVADAASSSKVEPPRASRPRRSWARWSRSRLLSSGSDASEAARQNIATASTEHWWNREVAGPVGKGLLSPAKKPKASCHRCHGVDTKIMSPVTFAGFCPTVVPTTTRCPSTSTGGQGRPNAEESAIHD